MPPIPERPTKEQARAALDMLVDLLSEFPFAQTIDRSVALAGLLTAHVRGSLPTAPVFLVRADTPGTGKSYLVDLFAMISTGRLCPVITASKNAEETEKRLGAVLLGGTNIVSLDNVMHDLGGELLCQLTERPVIKVRILGRSEMPECESHTAVFATGNNVTFKGDMVRRGLVCNLEAQTERPELREFKNDALAHAASRPWRLCRRGAYRHPGLPDGRRAAGLRPLRQLRSMVADGAQSAGLAGRARPDREHGCGAQGGRRGSPSIRELFGSVARITASTSTWNTPAAGSSRSLA